jgi:hypothetical protein
MEVHRVFSMVPDTVLISGSILFVVEPPPCFYKI